LTRRMQRLVALLAAKPTASVPEACGRWAETKAAYRLWASARVSAAEIRRAHIQRTLDRVGAHEVVLAVQDTTALDFSEHKGTVGLGPIGPGYVQGLLVHTTLAVSDQGVPLGMLDQVTWARQADDLGQSHRRRQRATADKESQRWLAGLETAQRVVPENKQLVVIADREADIYDLFIAPRRDGAALLIRAEYNRRVQEEAGHVWDAVRAAPEGGRWTVAVARARDRLPRDATVAVRWATVTVRPPHRGNRPDTSSVILTAVLVEEEAPPEGVTPIRWLLLTTLSVTTAQDAQRVVRWYGLRWLIERYHYVLKSGCRLEELQLESAERLERALATYAIVAWRLLWLTHEARQAPDRSCLSVLTEHEWQALYCTIHRTPHPPDAPPTLREAVRWIAQLGGFLGRKGDGEPGVKVIWRGFRRLGDIADTWSLLHPAAGSATGEPSCG
jgi:hypothetical protein